MFEFELVRMEFKEMLFFVEEFRVEVYDVKEGEVKVYEVVLVIEK